MVGDLIEGGASGGRVLVIDDDPQIRDLHQGFLDREGYLVATAADAREGLDLGRCFRPDIILLDIFMPGMTGIEAASRIRSDPFLGGCWVIASSGNWSLETRRAVSRAGVDDYLRRPFRLADLKGKLRNARATLERRRNLYAERFAAAV